MTPSPSPETLPLPPLPGRSLRPLDSLVRHPRLAVGVMALVLALGVPFALKKSVPTYKAETVIQVSPNYMRNLRGEAELELPSLGQYRQFADHNRRSFTRRDILREALRSLGERRSIWQAPGETEQHAIDRLQNSLVATMGLENYFLTVTLEAGDKEGVAELLNAVSKTFITRMREELIYGTDDRVVALHQREKELAALIDSKVTERSALAQDLSLTTFAEGTPNPYDKVVADLRSRLAEALHQRVQAETSLAAFKAHGDTVMSIRSVQEAVHTDPGLNSFKAASNNRRAALVSQESGLAKDHPGAEAAAQEITDIDNEIDSQGSKIENTVRSNVLARMQGTVEATRDTEKALQAELQQLEEQAAHFARKYAHALLLTGEIQQARGELDRVRERIGHLELEKTSPGFVRLITPAESPEFPSGPSRKKALLLVLLAALAAGGLAPTARDLMDRRLRSVNEIETLMGMPALGWQVERTNALTQAFGQDQLRRLAASMLRNRERGLDKVFGFTGCKSRAGTTTLVLELAHALRSLGYSVLAIEANGKTRDSRYGSASMGLLEALHGTAALPTDGSLTNLQFSARAGEGALERVDQLPQVLAELKQAYDFVLVDMPPLLESSDTELLLRGVQQAIVLVQALAVSRNDLKHARRLLHSAEPASVGLVVTRLLAAPDTGYLQLLMQATAGTASTAALKRDWTSRLLARLRNSKALG